MLVRNLFASFAIGALILTAGCAAEEEPAAPATSEVQSLGHVHGLGVNPGDQMLYAATHFGVIRIGDDGSLARIADRWQDTMAFTIIGPDHFLGSGHPDMREDLPPHLGMIESTDAASTWSSVSLKGEADFHALDVVGARIYAFDSVTGRLLTATDRKNWSVVAEEPVIDLVINPSNTQEVLTSSPEGKLQLRGVDSASITLDSAPPLLFLGWPTFDQLAGLAADGSVYSSNDQGETWDRVGRVPGDPEAFDVTGHQWHAATDQGIYRSEDVGRTWVPLIQVIS